jgi:hypothetical protein
MTRSRQKMTGRREAGQYTGLPHAVQDSANFRMLSGSAEKVLLAIARQYNGHNNGDLCATYQFMRQRGIRSPDTLSSAIRELRHYGLVELTRQGGRHAPSLYALTWRAVDECKGKLEVAATKVASSFWRQEREPFVRPVKNQNATTESVVHRYGIRINGSKKAA